MCGDGLLENGNQAVRFNQIILNKLVNRRELQGAMRTHIFVFLVVLSFFASSAAWAQPSPYFPETGRQAVVQDLREIQNPSVCLVIATAPGLEDLPTIAYLRVGLGARVAVAYITNGEDIPSDLNGETFYLLASRRKEEAYRALSYLGAESYFLNVPANEFPVAEASFHPTTELTETLKNRLDSLISEVKPDIIMLNGNPLAVPDSSFETKYLRSLLSEGIRAGAASHSWEVMHLFVQGTVSKGSVTIPVERKDPVWAESYVRMAHKARKFYKSLKYQIALWHDGGPHQYQRVYSIDGKTVRTGASRSGNHFPISGLLPGDGALEIGKRLKELLPAVSSVASVRQIDDRGKRLGLLRDVIARVDAFIFHDAHFLDKRDLRVLTAWKLGLEKLRCAILGVNIRYSVSDTVVTPLQLFFLKFDKLDRAFENGKTQLLFPGVVRKEWIADETQKEFYDWKDSAQFRVVSPRSIPLNSPETPEGFEAMQVRTPFMFIVVHKDSNPNYDFYWREEVPLTIAPYRSIEVMTPHVAMLHDDGITVRFKSNVRDRSGGEFYVEDSLVSSPHERVELPGKNIVVTDTLPLRWNAANLAQPRRVEILASQGLAIGSFTVHPLDPGVRVSRKVGLYSVIKDSPLKIALSRLGIEKTDLDMANSSPEDLSGYSAIIMDQFSYKTYAESATRLENLRRWVDSGGRLLIMPQFGIDMGSLQPGEETEFTYLPITQPSAEVFVDSTERFLNYPNRLTKDDFSTGAFPISFGGIRGYKVGGSKVLVSAQSGIPLVVGETAGHGEIVFCALNLYPRLLAVDEAAYMLLANLISN